MVVAPGERGGVSDASEAPGLAAIVLRGAKRRCARCGQGPLYQRWIKLHDNCPECGLRYLENQGDPWFFQVLIDRALFVLPIIAALFFGLHRSHLVLFVVLCAANVAIFFWTTPHRYGICVALDYYYRLRFGPLESGERALKSGESPPLITPPSEHSDQEDEAPGRS